jgi:hypothetical protein
MPGLREAPVRSALARFVKGTSERRATRRRAGLAQQPGVPLPQPSPHSKEPCARGAGRGAPDQALERFQCHPGVAHGCQAPRRIAQRAVFVRVSGLAYGRAEQT